MIKRARILIVDDEPGNIEFIARTLADAYEVQFATGGAMALELASQEPPSLILLDVMMPGVDGYQVLDQLKQLSQCRDVPVIFITGHDDMGNETRGLEAGAVDFISKPANPAVVRARVKTHLTLKAQSDQLRSQVFIDSLTGLANRRRFDECLALEWLHCQRYRWPLTLLFIDIDHFKLYNDYYGHVAGDACLAKVAEAIGGQFGRPHDVVARYGGEEFVCLLPECDMNKVRDKAHQLCDAVSELRIPHETSLTAPVVTISIGMATLTPGEDANDPEALTSLADQNLYLAKSQGRNRLCDGLS
ncbi:GGDEF domain-containing response regulator [Methylomonas methanica]|uniref:diguanylate cyclase n=1 Tax=Methylomonas methanica (strain DSM 25384 / MC09) TaxID=857087 RepID=G0A1Y8_METMM|nr:diguanylate cyclase [Methylomonas methanica]AEG01371.1 response regulator receiver modulated diguanylate cyclase [Methylomonas methanica MC09]